MEYLIGIIKKTHGLKGGVIVKSLTDFERFKKDEVVYYKLNNQNYELKIKEVNKFKNDLLVYFYNKDHISLVKEFKSLSLYTNKEPELKEDEYHFNDLIGKEVYNQHNTYIGIVIDLMIVPQGHILRIKTDKKDALVPFNEVFIKEVNNNIVINEIEGLIWK